MALTWPFLVYYGSTGGAVDLRRARSDCLLESAAFQRAEPFQRVVTSQFRPHGFGPYTLHLSVGALIEFVLRASSPARNFNIVLCDDGPIRLYLDLDMPVRLSSGGEGHSAAAAAAAPASTSADSVTSEQLLADVTGVLEEAFAKAYPARQLHTNHLWIFSASTSAKHSFHLHADPELPHAVWPSRQALSAFMKKHVKPLLDKLHIVRDARAQRLSWTTPDGVLHWMIDFSVYSLHQSIKLPLCRKPGKACMQLLRAPSVYGEPSSIPLVKQLSVGIPSASILASSSSGMAIELLPHLAGTARPHQQQRQRSSNHAMGVACRAQVCAASRELEVSEDARLRLLELVKPVVGPRAAFDSFRVDRRRGEVHATFSPGTATCLFRGRPHAHNRTRVVVVRKKQEMHLFCLDPECPRWPKRRPILAYPCEALFAGASDDDWMWDPAVDAPHAGSIMIDATNGGTVVAAAPLVRYMIVSVVPTPVEKEALQQLLRSQVPGRGQFLFPRECQLLLQVAAGLAIQQTTTESLTSVTRSWQPIEETLGEAAVRGWSQHVYQHSATECLAPPSTVDQMAPRGDGSPQQQDDEPACSASLQTHSSESRW